jgi:transposase, IS5 family
MAERMLGLFDVGERLVELSAKGDDLERVKSLIDFGMFREALELRFHARIVRKGDPPPHDQQKTGPMSFVLRLEP